MAVKPIIEISPIRAYQFCPKQFDFSYNQKLKPKLRPPYLDLGVGIHKCLEFHHRGEKWLLGLAEVQADYDKLLPEEKEHYGDIPALITTIVSGYLAEYATDDFATNYEVLATEKMLEVDVGPYVLRGRLDLLVRDKLGRVFLVDHKSTSSIPEGTMQLLDPQMMLYFALVKRTLNITADGLIFDYLVTTPPTEPKVVKNRKDQYYVEGSGELRLGASDISTDLRTVMRVLEANNMDTEPYEDYLETLRHQASPFYRRIVLPFDRTAVLQVVRELAVQAGIIHKSKVWPRHVGRHCNWCSFQELCSDELLHPYKVEETRSSQFERKE